LKFKYIQLYIRNFTFCHEPGGKHLSIYKRHPQGSSTIMKSWKQSSVGQDQLHCGTAIFENHTTVMTKERKVYMTIEGCANRK
jgi:hypothetical protein